MIMLIKIISVVINLLTMATITALAVALMGENILLGSLAALVALATMIVTFAGLTAIYTSYMGEFVSVLSSVTIYLSPVIIFIVAVILREREELKENDEYQWISTLAVIGILGSLNFITLGVVYHDAVFRLARPIL